MKRFRKLLSFIFLMSITIVFSETKIPHETVTDNPKKEVTTIETKKKKERAELNISVDKITPINVLGIKAGDNKAIYEIPKESMGNTLLSKTKIKPDPNGKVEYFITENLSKILNERAKYSRERGILPNGVKHSVKETESTAILTVETDKPVYIVKTRTGEIESIFKGDIKTSYPVEDLGSATLEVDNRLVQKPLSHPQFPSDMGLCYGFGWSPLGAYYGDGRTLASGNQIKSDEKFIEFKSNYKALSDKISGHLNDSNVLLNFSVGKVSVGLSGNKGGLMGMALDENQTDTLLYLKDTKYDEISISTSNTNSWIQTFLVGNFRTKNTGTEVISCEMDTMDKVSGTMKKYRWKLNLNYHEKTFSGKARLVMPKVERVEWEGGTTGGISGDANLIFSEGKLVDMKSFGNVSQVKRVVANKDFIDYSDNVGQKLSVKDNYYDIGITADGKFFVEKLLKDPPDRTYNIQMWSMVGEYRFLYPYMGTLELTIESAEKPKSIGEYKFKVDTRLKNVAGKKWIFANGNLARYLDTGGTENYSEMIRGEGNLINLPVIPNQMKVTDVLSIDGRHFNDGKRGNYVVYREYNSPENNINESAMPVDIYLETIAQHIATSLDNSPAPSPTTPQNNKFVLNVVNQSSGVRESFSGNIREEFVGEDIVELTGKVDFTGKGKNTATWASGALASGDLIPASDDGNISMVLTQGTKMFNSKSVLESNKPIVNRLKVTRVKDGQTQEVNEAIGTEIAVTFSDTKESFKILPDGSLRVQGVNESAENQYIIEPYYNDALLGKLTLTVKTEKPTIDLGYVKFRIDNRLKDHVLSINSGPTDADDLQNLMSYVLNKDGEVMWNKGGAFPDLMEIQDHWQNYTEAGYVNISPEKVIVEDKPIYKGSIKVVVSTAVHYVYTKLSNDLHDPMIIPIRNNYDSALKIEQILKKYMPVSVYCSNYLGEKVDKFIISNKAGISYRGQLRKEFVGKTAQTGAAVIHFPKGETARGEWRPGSTGKVQSVDGKPIYLEFSEGELLNTKGMKGTTVVTRIVDEITNTGVNYWISPGKESSIIFDDSYKIGVTVDGNLFVEKLKPNTPIKTYRLKFIYSSHHMPTEYQQIKLGTLNLTIYGEPTPVGERTFKVDTRLKNVDGKKWIFDDGKLGSGINANDKDDYSEMIKGEGSLTNLTGNTITEIISIKDRPVKDSGSYSYDGANFTLFQENSGNPVNESAMPYNIALNRITQHFATSIDNSPASSTTTPQDNEFTLKAGNDYFTGNLKEEFVGEDSVRSQGTINFVGTDHMATWSAGSTGESDDSSIRIEFTGTPNKLFDTRGRLKSLTSIATKLIITDSSDRELGKAENKDGDGSLTVNLTDGEMFKLDNYGRLTIKGRKAKARSTFKVKPYYKDALLGEFTVELITGMQFEIVGDDSFDFKQMKGGQEYNLTGDIFIKNLDNLTVIDVKTPTDAEMIHRDFPTEKIPLKIESSYKKVGVDIKTNIRLTAKPKKDQKVGNYSGKFFIEITIPETP